MSTRDRLVGAMATSMREKGLGSSAMKDVLHRAEVTAGSMYHFFPEGKEQLAAAAIVRAGAVGGRTLVESVETTTTVADGVSRFFELLMEDLQSSDYSLGCPIGVPTGEAAGTTELVRRAGRHVFSSWIETITEALVAEGRELSVARSLASVCVSLYEGASLLARAHRDATVIRDAIGAVRQLLAAPETTLA